MYLQLMYSGKGYFWTGATSIPLSSVPPPHLWSAKKESSGANLASKSIVISASLDSKASWGGGGTQNKHLLGSPERGLLGCLTGNLSAEYICLNPILSKRACDFTAQH